MVTSIRKQWYDIYMKLYQTQISRNHVEHSLSWFHFVLCHVTLIHFAQSAEQSCSHYDADPGIQGVVPHVISLNFYITGGLGIRNHRMESLLCFGKVVSRVAASLDVLVCLFMHGWCFLVSSMCFMLCFPAEEHQEYIKHIADDIYPCCTRVVGVR